MKPFISLTAFVAAVVAVAAMVRLLVVEPEPVVHLCGAAAAPWWCTLRAGVIAAFATNALAIAAVAAGVLAAATRRSGVALAAIGLGVAGLVLYSVEPGAVAFLLGLLALTRPRDREPGRRREREA